MAALRATATRAIVEGLFGAKHIPEGVWKTQDLRNRTIRLVQSGSALMRGGYRELLRKSRRNKWLLVPEGVSKIHPLIFGIPLGLSAPPL